MNHIMIHISTKLIINIVCILDVIIGIYIINSSSNLLSFFNSNDPFIINESFISGLGVFVFGAVALTINNRSIRVSKK